jgi:hypothetical protein
MLRIEPGDPGSNDVQELISEHLRDMHATSPPESVHALDPSGLADPTVTMWAVREDGRLLGFGALKELDPTTGEIKSDALAADGIRLQGLNVSASGSGTRSSRSMPTRSTRSAWSRASCSRSW